jgi:hypothetical protein
MATFVLSGVWHGASWNYVLWGAYHGALLVAHRAVRQRRWPAVAPRWRLPLAVAKGVGTFALVHVGWLLFRETDIAQLGRLLAQNPFAADRVQLQAAGYLAVSVLTYAWPLFAHDWIAALAGGREFIGSVERPRPVHAEARLALAQGLFGAALLTAILLLHSRTSLDFIYFQF